MLKLHELKHGLVHLFYPHLCEGCSKPLLAGEKVLCISCGLEMPETAYHHIENNETSLRFAGRVPFVHATSYAYFTNDGLLQHLIHGLKYKNKKETGRYLGRKFAESLRFAAYGEEMGNWLSSIDMIIPVPLHKKKQETRGYNQSMILAQGMSDTLKIPAAETLLIRTRDTETQTHKTRAERVTNMQAAFVVKDKQQLAAKHILLCDDVLTTGATLEACALALLAVEDIKISISTIGIAI